MVYIGYMYKNFQNRIMALPQGNPNPRVNLFWMLVFLPFLLPLAAFVAFVLWTVGEMIYESVAKLISG